MGRVTINKYQPTQDMAEATKSPQSDSSAPSGRVHPLVLAWRWIKETFTPKPMLPFPCPECGKSGRWCQKHPKLKSWHCFNCGAGGVDR